MTLILGIGKEDGLYLSVDYRVSRNGRTVDDDSVKHLRILYPPPDTGVRALLGYTGIAEAPDGTPTGQWIRETIRGGNEPFVQSMEHLRERLDRDYARSRALLDIVVLGFDHEGRFLSGVTNGRRLTDGSIMVTREFRCWIKRPSGPFCFAGGSGWRVVSREHQAILQRQLEVTPGRVWEHLKLLATINRRVASREPTVSPHCHVAFMNTDERREPQSRVFVQGTESVSYTMPAILFGVDTSWMAKDVHDHHLARKTGQDTSQWTGPLDEEEARRLARRRP